MGRLDLENNIFDASTRHSSFLIDYLADETTNFIEVQTIGLSLVRNPIKYHGNSQFSFFQVDYFWSLFGLFGSLFGHFLGIVKSFFPLLFCPE
jgi:hypothetical protein